MKRITKFRMFNKYNVISFIVMLIVLWISWAFVSCFIEILTMDYSAPDLGITSVEEKNDVRYRFIISILTWERYIDSAMNYMVYLFPIFSLITVIPFCVMDTFLLTHLHTLLADSQHRRSYLFVGPPLWPRSYFLLQF